MARSDKSNHITAECKVQEAMAENENRSQHHVHSADRASSRDVRSPFRFLRKSKSLSAVEIDVCLSLLEKPGVSYVLLLGGSRVGGGS